MTADSEIPSWAWEQAREALADLWPGPGHDAEGVTLSWMATDIDRIARALVAAWEAGRASAFKEAAERAFDDELMKHAEWCERRMKGDKP